MLATFRRRPEEQLVWFSNWAGETFHAAMRNERTLDRAAGSGGSARCLTTEPAEPARLAATLDPARGEHRPGDTLALIWRVCSWRWHHEHGRRAEVRQRDGSFFPHVGDVPAILARNPGRRAQTVRAVAHGAVWRRDDDWWLRPSLAVRLARPAISHNHARTRF
jgi:hypothetical protein